MTLKQGIKCFNRHTRFCTPGHKGRLLKSDVTELDGEFPSDLIEKSQESAAKILKTAQVRYLTNGSSIGIKASLMACGGDILAAKNCHQSIPEAAELANKKLILLENETLNGLKLPLTQKQIEAALKEYPSVKAVVLAHPDYYGLNADIGAAEAVKKAGHTLYVDAAHGAHYPFREDLFDCRIFRLADAFNLSAHKTLYSLTQTAILCINNQSLTQKIDKNLALLGTTSPFYPFYESIEGAVEYNLKHSIRYEKLKQESVELKKSIRCAENDDFTRVVVDAAAYALSGKTLFERLKAKRIAAEKYDERYVVFILTLADTPTTIWRLRRALEELCGKTKEN